MIALLRAEFRKLLTVRSTYIILTIAVLLVGFLAFYVAGYNSGGENPLWLSTIIGDTSTTVGIFFAIIAILLMCHEYRHNTVMYTLTYSNSRSKVLLAKVIAVIVFTLVLATALTAFAALMYRLGVAFSPRAVFVTSELFWGDVWRAAYYVLAYTLLGLVLATIIRHVAGVIATLFILPVVEQLLALLLKANSKYLPFVSLEQVHNGALLSPGKAALIFAGYLAAAWIVAWFLFVRRDAN